MKWDTLFADRLTNFRITLRLSISERNCLHSFITLPRYERLTEEQLIAWVTVRQSVSSTTFGHSLALIQLRASLIPITSASSGVVLPCLQLDILITIFAVRLLILIHLGSIYDIRLFVKLRYKRWALFHQKYFCL